jgi:glycyl-tRNA synthetase beta chain
VSLAGLVDRTLDVLAGKLTESRESTRERVLELIRTRLAAVMAGRGLRHDVGEAVLSQGFDDPHAAVRRAEALAHMMRQPDWEALTVAFKRAINILPSHPVPDPDPARFVDAAEQHLYDATTASRPRVVEALGRGDYEEALRELAGLRSAIDRFFQAVLVMDSDHGIRENRLGLLRGLAELVLPIADLRKIQQQTAAA